MVSVPGAIVAAALLTVAFLLALSYDPDTRHLLRRALPPIASSLAAVTLWRAAGFFSRALGALLFEVSVIALSAGQSNGQTYATGLVRWTRSFLQTCEERYFLVITLFLVTTTVLVFSG
jgi:hypothetical protein